MIAADPAPAPKPDDDEDCEYWVYREPLIIKLISVAGWVLGWGSYWLARAGFHDRADSLIDHAIVMRRANAGAVRAVGYLNGLQGWPAGRRGRFLIRGKIHQTGPFANKGFFATYHIAARNHARALQLVKRFEWDAVPGSLMIEEGELDHDDPGAEGVLWIASGRTFFPDED